jgi:hypothetical protein
MTQSIPRDHTYYQSHKKAVVSLEVIQCIRTSLIYFQGCSFETADEELMVSLDEIVLVIRRRGGRGFIPEQLSE